MYTTVGLDIGKNHIDACLLEGNKKKYIRISNTPSGLKTLKQEVKGLKIKIIVCEASGGYEKLACTILHRAGYGVHRVNTYSFSQFARSINLCKTDKEDSAKLAFYGHLISPQENIKDEEDVDQLKAYQQHREDLVQALGNNKRRLGQATEKVVIQGIKRHIQFLEKEIKRIEVECQVIIQKNNDLERKINILKSIPGIGECLAIKLITFLPELGKETYKFPQLCSITGIAPYARDSGSKNGRRFIRGGRKIPRDALFMGVITGHHKISLINDLRQRLLNKGKAKKVAIVACMRKLLAIAHSLIRRDTFFVALLKR